MIAEHAPVWVWDGYWWPAYVVLPILDSDSEMMLVRFENGVTAPVKVAAVRYRDLSRTNHFSAHPSSLPQHSLSMPHQVSAKVADFAAASASKSNRRPL